MLLAYKLKKIICLEDIRKLFLKNSGLFVGSRKIFLTNNKLLIKEDDLTNTFAFHLT